MTGEVVERLALLYSDGSLGVFLDSSTVEEVRGEAEFADEGEDAPEHFTRVVRVRVEVVEYVDGPASSRACPKCGAPRPAGRSRNDVSGGSPDTARARAGSARAHDR